MRVKLAIVCYLATIVVCILAQDAAAPPKNETDGGEQPSPYGEQYCRNLCGKCPLLDDCKDEFPSGVCALEKYYGNCDKESVKFHCTKTCDKCPPESCKDKFSGCSKIKFEGLCTKKQHMAKKYCARTCLLCD